MKRFKNRKGFTILEMLVVVAVMAIIASLATGGAIKSVRAIRQKRIDATKTVLTAALNNYRAQQNEWPFRLSELDRDNKDRTLFRAEGDKNAVVFEELFKTQNRSVMGDTSGLLTMVNGRRMSVKQALEQNLSPIAIGYPNPNNTDQFIFFNMEYNSITDTIRIY